MKVGRWKRLLPLAVLAVGSTIAASGALATTSQSGEVRVAIMTDCKGAFAFGYEVDTAGTIAALSQYAGAKPKNKKKPSAGMTGGVAGGKRLNLVGIGCGDETPALALKETRRLMNQLGGDVMIGPLSGDEAVAIANWAKQNPSKTVIIGTAGSQDPTMQIAPRNVFRYHGDGAQWNAGLGEILYKKLGWRTAALIGDDYSFPWTSAAGIIADFCGIGGKITKRVWTPVQGGDYAPFIRQLPRPDQVDGYFWLVGGANTSAALTAFQQAYGPLNAKQHSGNLFLYFLGANTTVAPRLVGSYMGGFGTFQTGGLKTPQARAYVKNASKWYGTAFNVNDGFFYNYWNAAWALVQGLNKSNGQVGSALQRALPRSIKPGFQVANNGVLKLDSRRQAIQDQYPLQITKAQGSGSVTTTIAGYVPNVDQSFGGYFGPNKKAPGRTVPACVKRKLPWQGKIRVVKNGVITNQVIK
jgi:branched-chain amino acid transport system substrate-binding protein